MVVGLIVMTSSPKKMSCTFGIRWMLLYIITNDARSREMWFTTWSNFKAPPHIFPKDHCIKMSCWNEEGPCGTFHCGVWIVLMDRAVKNYLRSADYTEMQKSAVIYSSRHFFKKRQQNVTILSHIEDGKWPCMWFCMCILQKWIHL